MAVAWCPSSPGSSSGTRRSSGHGRQTLDPGGTPRRSDLRSEAWSAAGESKAKQEKLTEALADAELVALSRSGQVRTVRIEIITARYDQDDLKHKFARLTHAPRSSLLQSERDEFAPRGGHGRCTSSTGGGTGLRSGTGEPRAGAAVPGRVGRPALAGGPDVGDERPAADRFWVYTGQAPRTGFATLSGS